MELEMFGGTPSPMLERFIVRGVLCNGRVVQTLPVELKGRKLRRLWTVYNEPELMALGYPIHNAGVFLEDRIHDYQFDSDSGRITFYSRVVDKNESLPLLFEVER